MKIPKFLFFVSIFLILGCTDETPSPITNPSNNISFQIEQLNANISFALGEKPLI